MPCMIEPPSSTSLSLSLSVTRRRPSHTMRRTAREEAELKKPLKFSIGSDDEDDGSAPTRLPRHYPSDAHTPPSLLHLRIIRWILRLFPRVLLALVIAALVVAMLPGGWRVALCAANLLPPPAMRPGENLTLVAHRGCEFPYPENSLHALKFGASLVGFVELDISLTNDGHVVAMHDDTLDRTTNGTGPTCEQPLEHIKSLEVKMPERDPRGRIRQAKYCSDKTAGGQSVPCTYRVPTLNEVFDALPEGTRYMLDVKNCYAPGIKVTSLLCSNCTILRESVKKAMADNFIKPKQIVFTSVSAPSLKVFQDGLPVGYELSLGMKQTFSHYKRKTLMALIEEGNFNSASLYVGLAAVRPDFVRALRETKMPGSMKHRDAFAWTIRRDFDFRLARCAGVTNLVVAEPKEAVKRHRSMDVESLLAENEDP